MDQRIVASWLVEWNTVELTVTECILMRYVYQGGEKFDNNSRIPRERIMKHCYV